MAITNDIAYISRGFDNIESLNEYINELENELKPFGYRDEVKLELNINRVLINEYNNTNRKDYTVHLTIVLVMNKLDKIDINLDHTLVSIYVDSIIRKLDIKWAKATDQSSKNFYRKWLDRLDEKTKIIEKCKERLLKEKEAENDDTLF